MSSSTNVLELDRLGFEATQHDEALDVEGGMAQIVLSGGALAGVVALGVGLAAGALAAGVAVGYYVNKNDCPDDESNTSDGGDTADTGR